MENLKNLVNNLINNFKNNLKYRVYWIDKNNHKILIREHSKSESKKKLLKMLKILRNSNKEINLVRVVITFHSGIKKFQGGKVKINIKQFVYKDNKLKKNNIIGENGNLWLSNTFFTINKLNQKKFEEFLLKRIKDLQKNKLKLLAINIINS
jgi:hypothetical protein